MLAAAKEFHAPGAELLAFNSAGACPTCSGTGIVREVNRAALVPDESKSIDDGAVLPWGSLMWDLMKQVCGAMGVRTNVPFNELTPEERDIVFNGPAVKKHILYKPKKGDDFAELDFTYFNAVYTVENALAKAKDEKGLKRVVRFLKGRPMRRLRRHTTERRRPGPACARAELGRSRRDDLGRGGGLGARSAGIPARRHAADGRQHLRIVLGCGPTAARSGLGYLALDRAGATLSTGERQRVQLARAVRNRTIGVLYVLDEPSIGLHPSNVDGLLGVMHDLVADGNSVVVVDHDVRVLKACDHLIEMGPVAGAEGGHAIAQGTVGEVAANPSSRIAPFLSDQVSARIRERVAESQVFSLGHIRMTTSQLHTVKPLDVDIPRGRLVAVTGVSGSGKTTMVLESLIPALKAQAAGELLPEHVHELETEGIRRANLIDATPIGANVRSTVATYADIHDELRRAFARCEAAKTGGWKAGDFSYNTGRLRCPTCDGTGSISLDVQFLPDVTIECPDCCGSRYAPEADAIRRAVKGESRLSLSLPQLMAMSVDQALAVTSDLKKVHARLTILHDLGLGYLTLGEPTPALSGGEAQRLKLASEMGKAQLNAVFVFDEPTIGLHPLDVRVLLGVFDRLVVSGATVVVIEHDLDVIANADWIIDMGPGGGESGGRIVATGTPEQVAANPNSITGRYLR